MRAAPARPSPPKGSPRPVTPWLWAGLSAGLHVALFLLSALVGGGGVPLRGAGGPRADGFGGNSVELEIAGSEDSMPQGALSAGHATPLEPDPEPPPPPALGAPARTDEPPVALETPTPAPAERPESRPEVAAPPAPAERPESRPEVAAQRERRRASPGSPRDLPEAGDPTAATTAAPGVAPAAQGTGASDSTAGIPGGDASRLILGAASGLGDGASARRALLPNGGACDDPIVGVWRAQKFRASDRTWVRFVLRIRREGDELRGTITSRIWSGTPSSSEPGPCMAFGSDHTWRMAARGRLEGTQVSFGSRSARLVEQHCASVEARYAPDNFSGTLHPQRELFESHNNDGAFDIEEPYTFRRVACE